MQDKKFFDNNNKEVQEGDIILIDWMAYVPNQKYLVKRNLMNKLVAVVIEDQPHNDYYQDRERELDQGTYTIVGNICSLTQGEKIYKISGIHVVSYTYLCVHPTGGGNYHILIGQGQDPIRIHKTELIEILSKNLKSWEAAKLALADHLEKLVESLRELPY